MACAEAAGGGVRLLQKGDQVLAWSNSGKTWLGGCVDDILEEPLLLPDQIVPKGALKIRLARGLKFVPAPRAQELLKFVAAVSNNNHHNSSNNNNSSNSNNNNNHNGTTRSGAPQVLVVASVVVVAPGAGTGANCKIYEELKQDERFNLKVLGKKGAPYDRYPECWEKGSSPPNLESFAGELVSQDLGELLILGSRGGQVVLPYFWRVLGSKTPPAVVINGGCAMKARPGPATNWPVSAVTFRLLGGQDFFRGKASPAEYVASAKQCVPPENGSTAILFVSEMQHVPQASLLGAVLSLLLMALLSWKASGSPPKAQFQSILSRLEGEGCWSGRLLFTAAAGLWEEIPFGSAVQADDNNKNNNKSNSNNSNSNRHFSNSNSNSNSNISNSSNSSKNPSKPGSDT
ncbi:unnamed protein product, partial [Polarella glacialis]